MGHPAYVLEIRPEEREVVLGKREELRRQEMLVESCRWLIPDRAPGSRFQAQVQIRAHHDPSPVQVQVENPGRVLVSFGQPEEAGAPGQAAVFYDAERVLGGGWIARSQG